MKYLLMMNSPKGDGKYQIDTWAEMDLKAHLQFLADFNKRLKESGEFAGVQGLTSPGQAKLVRANSDGTPNTDGVFPESKEFLAGYWIVDVESEQRAIEIAAEASAAPGPGGRPLNMPIEVRQVMSNMPGEDARDFSSTRSWKLCCANPPRGCSLRYREDFLTSPMRRTQYKKRYLLRQEPGIERVFQRILKVGCTASLAGV